MRHSLIEYCRSLIDFAGLRAIWVGLLVLLGALVDGFSLLAILPFLELFAGDPQSDVGRTLDGWLTWAGFVTRNSQIAVMLCGFLALILLRGVIGWFRTVQLSSLGQEFVEHWRLRVFRAINAGDWLQLVRLQKHDATHAITNDVGRIASGTDQIFRAFTTVVLVTVQIGVAVYLSPWLALIVLGFVILAAAIATPYLAQRARLLGNRRTQFGRGLQQMMLHFMSGLKTAKAEGAHDYPDHVAEVSRQMRVDTVRFTGQTAAAQAGFQLASAIAICLTVVVGLIVIELPIFTLATFMLVLVRISTPIFGLVNNMQAVSYMLPAFEHLRQLEDDLGRYSETEQPLANGTVDTNPLPVTFKSVSFAYPDQGDQVLNTIDLILSPGEMVALSGPSGRGKTTLLDMIAGLMPPDDGRIEHGGKSIHDCKYEGALRSQIAYLSQDAFLFDVSLRENMVWGGREASDSEIADALQIAAADGIVARLPEGLETRAGERGQLFSGGERQRLCLAAKLLRRPKLLLLDEATGAIDRETELGILSRLRELRSDMTILLATHRPVDHGTFDAIWAMEEGGRLAVVSRPS